MKKFPGIIDFWGKRMIYFWLIVFALFGLIIWILSGDKGWFLITGGWALFLFILVFLGDIPWINYYIVGENKIIAVRVWRKSFLFENIADIRKISWKDLKEMTQESWIKMTLVRYNKRYARAHAEEIIPTIKSAYRYNRLISYMTAAPATRVYEGRAETLVKPVNYVLLTMSDGKQYVLSPKNPDEFLKLIPIKRNE